ncbi:hypothetical protein PIB30_074178 [Stylosanthes scabra]|uniref:Uncharacterized protein n=1 Tax=Stylosanthes scabra TaxID=79078 RepID=A0ABU6QRV5_9FABA|nr:hypothetical protein [Stylosanthes scabra]
MRKICLRSEKEVVVMAEEKASNSSTSTDDSAATDKTQPSPSKVASIPLNVSASSWVPPNRLLVAGYLLSQLIVGYLYPQTHGYHLKLPLPVLGQNLGCHLTIHLKLSQHQGVKEVS